MRSRHEPLTAEQASDLATVLAMPARPSPAVRMPSAPLAIRVKTSPWVRRALPTSLVVRATERRAAASWEENEELRDTAKAIMETVVAGTSRAGELPEIARRFAIESRVDGALSWQPWAIPRVDARSRPNLDAALTGGRGVLLSACHTGPYYSSMGALAARGVVPYIMFGPWWFQKPGNDYSGRRLANWHRNNFSRTVLAQGSFPILRALLERGDVVYLHFDVPGSQPSRFLGKPAMLASGSAQLAAQTGALVAPVRARRVGHRTYLDVGTLLDPHDFEDAGELHAAMAAWHENWILEDPGAMDDPNSFGWDGGATAETWVRPAPG